MKKVILLFIAVWASASLFAQAQHIVQTEKGVTSYKGQNPNEVVIKKFVDNQNTAKATLDESFEGTTFPPAGWSLIDQDGDGENFFLYNGGTAHTGVNSATSASWVGGTVLTPNNHLVTPALIPAAGDSLSFWYAAQDPDYTQDKFQVLVSTTGKAAANFMDTLYVKTIMDTTWTIQKLSLASYVGDTIFVSFNHFDCTDWFYMKLDDIVGPTIYYAPDIAITDISEPTSACGLGNETVTVEISNNSDVAVSTFDVKFKVDNGTYTTESYSGTAIPAFGSVNYTFTATANLSALGAHTITAMAVMTGDDDPSNDEMTINVENFSGKTIPYAMGFETGESLAGWAVEDANLDGATWANIENGLNPNNGTGYIYCVSPTSDDWLITPCLDLQTGVDYEFSVWTKTRAGGNESFSVYIGTSPDATGLSTKLKDENVASDQYYKVDAAFTVTTAGLYYIGIHANSAASAMTLYLDDIMIDDVVAGIDQAGANLDLTMYPNPANNILNVRAGLQIDKITIVNIIGQDVLVNTPNDVRTSMDITTLENGIYFVNFEINGQNVIRKLTVKR
jgi:hypothetical protein